MDSFLERYYSALKLGTSLTEYRDKVESTNIHLPTVK